MEPLESHSPTLVRPLGFLDLPFEIRLQIYQFVVPWHRIIDGALPFFTLDAPTNPSCGVFLLCKQISAEALDVLYDQTVIILHLNVHDEYRFKADFAANLSRIRLLLLVAQPRGKQYGLPFEPDDELWKLVLPGLKILRIVAKRPFPYVSQLSESNLMTADFDDWFWPFLRYFSEHIGSGTVVQVDFNECEGMRSFLEASFPLNWKEIRCRLVGNYVFFNRARLSVQPTIWREEDGLM